MQTDCIFVIAIHSKITWKYSLLCTFLADNYAWYFANKYYASLWGWTDDGASSLEFGPTAAEANLVGQPGEIGVDPSYITLPAPENCHPVPAIDAVNVTYECDMPPPATLTESVAPVSTPPLTGPCNCNESGCTADSPACCANGSCP